MREPEDNLREQEVNIWVLGEKMREMGENMLGKI